MPQKTLVFSFGRFQPPTKGHAVLFKELVSVARKERGTPMIFLSSKQDQKENPLSWEEKRDIIERGFPELSVGPKEAKNPLLALDWMLNNGYTRLICYVGGKREEDFRKLITGWQNAAPGRDHLTIELVGIPRTGSMDPKKVSGTTARLLAQQGNQKDFKDILLPGISSVDARRVMTMIQDRLGKLDEDTEYMPFSSLIEVLFEADDPDDQVLQQASQEAEDKDETVPRPDEDAVSAEDLPKKIAQQKGSIDAREAERVPSDTPGNQSKLVIHPDARLKKTMAANLQRLKNEREALEESFTAEELLARC